MHFKMYMLLTALQSDLKYATLLFVAGRTRQYVDAKPLCPDQVVLIMSINPAKIVDKPSNLGCQDVGNQGSQRN